MTRVVSTETMVQQLEGLLHTRDLSLREADFVASLAREREAGRLHELSDKQVAWMADLHSRHFAN